MSQVQKFIKFRWSFRLLKWSSADCSFTFAAIVNGWVQLGVGMRRNRQSLIWVTHQFSHIWLEGWWGAALLLFRRSSISFIDVTLLTDAAGESLLVSRVRQSQSMFATFTPRSPKRIWYHYSPCWQGKSVRVWRSLIIGMGPVVSFPQLFYDARILLSTISWWSVFIK